MKPRFNPLAILALIAVAALLTAAVVPSSFVFPTRQAVQTLTGSRALVSNSSGLLTNSTVTTTELAYVSGVTSAIQTQLDAKATAANLTTVSNTVTTQGNTLATNTALLNGTNTFTGTNNFTGTVLITNAASTISGNGAGLTNIGFAANGIGIRQLFRTNLFVASVPAYVATTPTNNGDYSLITQVFAVPMPALLTTNSRVFFSWNVERTNTLAANCNLYWYVGSNTNFVLGGATQVPSTIGRNAVFNAATIFQNFGSFTNQAQGGNAPSPYIWGTTNFVDTSAPWTLYLALQSSSTATNIILREITISEAVGIP